MPIQKTEAIVLKVIDYSESSQIATFYTERYGKIQVIAKGAKKEKSRFQGALEPVSHCEIVFTRSRSSTLHTLSDLDLLDGFHGARGSLPSHYAVTYVVELLREITAFEDPSPELFALTAVILKRIAAGGSIRILISLFEAKVLKILGLLPEMRMCSACSGELKGEPRPTFDPQSGGAICTDCSKGKRGLQRFSAGTYRILSALSDIDPSRIERVRIPELQQKEMRNLMDIYLLHTLEKPLKLSKYIREEIWGETTAPRENYPSLQAL